MVDGQSTAIGCSGGRRTLRKGAKILASGHDSPFRAGANSCKSHERSSDSVDRGSNPRRGSIRARSHSADSGPAAITRLTASASASSASESCLPIFRLSIMIPSDQRSRRHRGGWEAQEGFSASPMSPFRSTGPPRGPSGDLSPQRRLRDELRRIAPRLRNRAQQPSASAHASRSRTTSRGPARPPA